MRLGASYSNQILEAKITQVSEPFTLACVIAVELDSPVLGLTGNMVLKLLDGRFAPQARENKKAKPWTLDIEREYHQFILDGGESNNGEEDGDEEAEEEEEWSAPQNEAVCIT